MKFAAAAATAAKSSLAKGAASFVGKKMMMSSSSSAGAGAGAGAAAAVPPTPSSLLRRGMMASAVMPRPQVEPPQEEQDGHGAQQVHQRFHREEEDEEEDEAGKGNKITKEAFRRKRTTTVTPVGVPLVQSEEEDSSNVVEAAAAAAGKTYPMWLGLEIEPREYSILTKSRIKEVFEKHMGGSALDHRPYVAAASVLPMRTNNYVVEDLVDWQKAPDDPMFQLVFPQPGMLSPKDLQRSMAIIDAGVTGPLLREAMESIRAGLNPHPAGQKTLNVPSYDGEQVKGMQHKYRETVLFFATEAQYCHSFCTYCFRWAQFTAVGSNQQFASKDSKRLRDYLRANRDVSDVLFTGGDPMVMNAQQLSAYVDPILQDPTLDHVATIRFGTKAVAYWPYRFITDPDADDTLRVFQRIVESGRHVSIMAHFSHPNELTGPVPQEAIRRIRSTGANVRTQAPLINHVNADPATWASMWRLQTRLGAIPYYMFVERDTGARKYFEVPLAKAYDIYSQATMATSGTVRTVRGPSMSATPGKVQVVGITSIKGEKVFVLRFLQARNPQWCNEVFFAKFDDKAVWLDDLRPAFGQEKFFYEDELDRLSRDSKVSSGQAHPLRGDGQGVEQGPSGDSDADADAEVAGAGAGAGDGGGAAFGRGICLGGGTGSMVYRNDVIPPSPPLLRGQQ